jgi:hypothetical protein
MMVAAAWSSVDKSFGVQCPTETPLHSASAPAGIGQIKWQHIGGTIGFETMGDGNQNRLFNFAPLSGLGDPNDTNPYLES